jgi:nucleotide-binding universal stress UspA family protein
MTEIIAALDNSLAATPVLTSALALGQTLDANVVPVHVGAGASRVVENAADRAGLELRTRQGPVVKTLLAEVEREDVFGLVLGSRGTPGDRRPLGSTAFAIATAVGKPVVVVPPDARASKGLKRVLIPIEGGLSAKFAPLSIIELARTTTLDVVAVHVQEPIGVPAFTDQPQHEQTAWAHEFLRRYCPWGIGTVRLEFRIGNAAEVVPAVAEEAGVDIIAIAWAQELAEGRAPVVRAALTRAKVPVMLVPVAVHSDADAALTREEEAWSRSQSLPV